MTTSWTTAQFWLAAGEIIVINILLSADNAVVMALACRHLDREQRTVAMVYGVVGTVVLLVGLSALAGQLLALPYLKLVGAALLAWIGIRLVVEEDRAADEDAAHIAARLGSAVRTVIVADVAMSFDNVLGVAAVANGNVLLLTVGLGVSIPAVAFGARPLIRLMNRLWWLPIAGGGLLGYVAGDLARRDPALMPWVLARLPTLHRLLPFVGMAVVLTIGTWRLHRHRDRRGDATRSVRRHFRAVNASGDSEAAPRPREPS